MSVWANRRNQLRGHGQWGDYVETSAKKDAAKKATKKATKKKSRPKRAAAGWFVRKSGLA